eukprot:GSMAST32.ASY1.ANO1.313.1 assembled CDS
MPEQSDMGLFGLGVMGQNFALNVASHGFNISVHNRSERLADKLTGFKDAKAFVASLKKPRRLMFLVTAGKAWFEFSIARSKRLEEKQIQYVAMGVSACSASDGENGDCMVHNGIEYGDMQLIAESYDILKHAGLSNEELANIFDEWNKGPLESFLIEITAKILAKKDDDPKNGHVVDTILDATGNKGTGKMTVKEAATRGVPCPTICAALDARFVAFDKSGRVESAPKLDGVDVNQLKEDVRKALYASKICSYSQAARIWKGGCIIRAHWRRVVSLCVACGVACPAMSASLSYFDQYRRARLPANLVQAQRDFFGSHTFERTDKPRGEKFHCIWTDKHQMETGH